MEQDQRTKLSVTDLILPGCLQRLEAAAPRAGWHSHTPPAQDQPAWPGCISMEHIPSWIYFGKVVLLNFRLLHLRSHSPGAPGGECGRLIQWLSTTDHPPSPGEHWVPLAGRCQCIQATWLPRQASGVYPQCPFLLAEDQCDSGLSRTWS